MIWKSGAWIILILGLLLAGLLVGAQEEMRGAIITNLNVRSGPGTEYAVLGTATAGAPIIIEGRNAIGDWLLAHTQDSNLRGWMASRYVNWENQFDLASMPVVTETITAVGDPVVAVDPPSAQTGAEGIEAINALPEGLPSAPPPPQETLALLTPEREQEMVSILSSMPVIPSIGETARAIYRRGQELGRDAHVVTEVGDCNADDARFLDPFAFGQYTLGSYAYLQSTVDHYAASMARDSIAGEWGLISTMVIDSIWSNPAYCNPDETLVACEYRISNASVAFITFGMFESFYNGHLDVFREAMRAIIEETINLGVIPVLIIPSTAPGAHQPVGLEYNRIMVELGRQYDIPMLNYWRAARQIFHYGLTEDQLHFSDNQFWNTFLDFTGDQNVLGYTLLNLLMIQTLQEIRLAFS